MTNEQFELLDILNHSLHRYIYDEESDSLKISNEINDALENRVPVLV